MAEDEHLQQQNVYSHYDFSSQKFLSVVGGLGVVGDIDQRLKSIGDQITVVRDYSPKQINDSMQTKMHHFVELCSNCAADFGVPITTAESHTKLINFIDGCVASRGGNKHSLDTIVARVCWFANDYISDTRRHRRAAPATAPAPAR